MRRLGPVLVLLMVLSAPLEAARPSLEVNLDPQKLGVQDVARLSLRIVNAGQGTPQTSLGQLNNFEIVQGPSRESQFSLINGRASSALKLTWILKPKATGKAAVGPITVKVSGETFSAGAVVAEIVAGSLARNTRPRRINPFGVGDPFDEFFGRARAPQQSLKVMLRRILTMNRAFEGQSLIASVVLDSNGGNINGFEWDDPPDYPGFWVQQIEQPKQVQPTRVEIDGESYARFVLARSVLIPLKAGNLKIPAASARIGFRSMSFFSPSSVIERSTEARNFKVDARPAPPQGFAGGVGQLKYSIKLKPQGLKLGQSASIEISVKGRGNLPLIQAPSIWPEPESCKVYPPEEENSVKVDASGIHGSRTWRATILPRQAGVIELPAIPVAVFDPQKRSYRGQKLGPLHLEVEAAEPTPTPTPPSVSATTELPSAQPEGGGKTGGRELPNWVLIAGALLVGSLGGGGLAWWLTRASKGKLPPRHRGQSPAERARQLQAALEAWWLELPESRKGDAAEAEMNDVRKALEAVRFAPGRADHTDTITELEQRLKRLIR